MWPFCVQLEALELASALTANGDNAGASDDITGGVISSDAVLSGSGVASKPVAINLASTVGVYNLPEWAGWERKPGGHRTPETIKEATHVVADFSHCM